MNLLNPPDTKMDFLIDANSAIELQALNRVEIIQLEEKNPPKNITKHTNKNTLKDVLLGLKEILKKLKKSS
jgi:hypothetical protein